uniref:Uncharacterized protein n=1 Tax=Romanomermis culicivorax TaxID=13658 RepID=A0A915HHB6_ROMCU
MAETSVADEFMRNPSMLFVHQHNVLTSKTSEEKKVLGMVLMWEKIYEEKTWPPPVVTKRVWEAFNFGWGTTGCRVKTTWGNDERSSCAWAQRGGHVGSRVTPVLLRLFEIE